MRKLMSALVAILTAFSVVGAHAQPSPDIQADAAAKPALTWKAAAATAVITPKDNMWMAGYAARKAPSEGVAQQLFAKALALEGTVGGPFVLVTSDIIGIRREVRDAVAERCRSEFALPPERLLLNASHTHCGPEYRPRAGREEEAKNYQRFLEETLVRIVGEALRKRKPAAVGYTQARCGFAMNRRRNYSLAAGDPLGSRAPT